MSSRRLRLFVAASLPDHHLDWVDDQTDDLRERWPEARWTPRVNQHITLKFLGSTDLERLDAVTSICREVAAGHAPGSVAPSELGVFPSLKRARVLWIGLEDPGRLLAALANDLALRLADLGFEPEQRSFSAHLTIARFRAPVSIGDLPRLPAPPGASPVTSFELWRSELSPRGARYTCLESYPLGI